MALRHIAPALLALSVFVSTARADLGDADPTFGVEGVVELPASCGTRCSAGTVAMARQSDGKILVVGYAQNDSRSQFSYSVHVRRFHPDGAPDTTFNSGVPLALFGGSGGSMSEYDRAIAVQSDGKILAAGRVQCLPSPFAPPCAPSLSVVRMLDDGTLDPTFGTAGRTTVAVSIQNSVGMAVLPDGRIVVAARQAVSPPVGYQVYRFTAAGALDTTFGSGGSVSVSTTGDNGSPYTRGDFAVLADGRMFLAHLEPMAVVRLTAEGAPDSGFNGTGFASIPTSEAGEAMLANEDGSVFLASSLYGSNFNKVAGRVRRLNAGGSLDTSWGQGGARDFADSFVVRTLGRQADGRLVAMGSSVGMVAFRRWLADGNTDGSLRGAGYAISTVAGTSSARTQLLMLPEGKALALFGSSLARFGGAYDIDDNRLFVAQQFRDFLGRAPDQPGVDFWEGRLSSGSLTRAQLVEAFFNSPEFDGTVAPVVRLYFAYFMRFPDFPGLLYWTGAFRQGTNLGGMSWSFAQSAEFMQLYGPLDNSQFVSRVYQNVLGRQPDAEGLIYWRNRLDTGSITRGDMMASFSESPEFRSVVRNEVFVAMTYAGMLRRSPDSSGFMFWVNQLDAGNSSAGLTQAVLDSDEYEQRFAQ